MARRGLKEFSTDAAGMTIRGQHSWPLRENTPNILFLHGYKDALQTFFPLIDHLDERYNYFLIDFRGHGQSDRISNGASAHLLDHLRDLSFVCNSLPPLDLVVAHSMGSNIALLYGASNPSFTKHLMLIDGIGAPQETADNVAKRLAAYVSYVGTQKKARRFDSFEDAKHYIATTNHMLSPLALDHVGSYLIVKESDGAYRFSFDPNLSGPAPTRFNDTAWQGILQSVRAHVFIVAPERGFIAQHPNYSRRIKLLRKAKLQSISQCGHMAHIDASSLVAKWIDTILA